MGMGLAVRADLSLSTRLVAAWHVRVRLDVHSFVAILGTYHSLNVVKELL